MKLKDIKKYLTKNTLIIFLAVCSALAIYSGVNLRSKMLLARAEVASSRHMYSVVEKEKVRLDSLVGVYKKSIVKRDAVIISKDKKIKQQQYSLKVLKDSLNNVLSDNSNVTVDSSYNYISLRVPPVAELKYKFDSVQVKNIHYNYLERDGLTMINSKLITINTDIQQLSSIKDNQISELKSLNNVYISKEIICRREKEAILIELNALNKNVKKQKFMKTLSNGTVVGLAGYIIIKALVE